MGTDFQIGKIKSSEDLFHSNVNILVKCTIKSDQDGRFSVICFFNHNKINVDI